MKKKKIIILESFLSKYAFSLYVFLCVYKRLKKK